MIENPNGTANFVQKLLFTAYLINTIIQARIKCTFGLPPNEDHHVIKLARDASHEQLYQSIAEEYGQPLVVYKYLDSEGSPITVREGSRLDLAELLEDIPAKQYLRLFVREPQKIIEPKSPVFSAVKK